MKKRLFLFLFLPIFLLISKAALTCDDYPRLWPTSGISFINKRLTNEDRGRARMEMERLVAAANQAIKHAPYPFVTLHSAGVIDINDQKLIHTRKAFRDADRFALLSLAFTLTSYDKYLESAKAILLAWAKTNKPTGNPIDETSLEGFIWGYDLLRCYLNEEDSQLVKDWLLHISKAKRAWKFGPKTKNNNHKTHHLKMLLMLDKVLDQSQNYHDDIITALAHLKINLPNVDGSSLDYHERDALYYHVYNLEAWLEIALVSGCCTSEIDRAFAFLKKLLISDTPHLEFQKSTSNIDRKRADGGFDYTQAGKAYEIDRAARAIISYYTLRPQLFDQSMWNIATKSKYISSLIFYQYRHFIWQNR